MAHENDFSREFLAWRASPGRCAAGALVGLVLAWIVGGLLLMGMVEPAPGTAPVSSSEFLLVMAVPMAAGGTACLSRRVRYWGGAVVPGALAGWGLGLSTFLGLGLLAIVT